MSRYRHDSTRAVAHQDKVADPYRDILSRQRVLHGQSGGHAPLFHGGHVRFGNFHDGNVIDECSQCRLILGSLKGEGVLWRNGEVSDPHKRIRSGSINLYGIATPSWKTNGRAFRASDPVALHRKHLLRPAAQLVEVIQ